MSSILEGVYSETKTRTIGTMGTSRTQEVIDYYRCSQLDENIVQIQSLDIYGDVLPLVEKVELNEFLKRFTYEPDKFKVKQTPQSLAVEKAVATAENHVLRKEYNSAEYEYSKALRLDKENVRANFGIGKLYASTGELDKASKIFSQLARQDNLLEPDNKHFFNELGIELRALALYTEAKDFYKKALTVAPDDEHLLFNIARAAFEGGDKELAQKYLIEALGINPNFKSARLLLAAL